MPRPCQRVRLETGLSLDLNRLARGGFIHPGTTSRPAGIMWTGSRFGDEIASGIVSSDLTGPYEGWLWVRVGDLGQKIHMVARPRHFGGYQWFFICPDTMRRAMVIWMPPRADHFASRQAWGRQVAYTSQFASPVQRAHLGKAKINSRLCGGFDPDGRHLPPKPKGMRWHTYERAVEKFDRYQEILDQGIRRALQRRGLEN
jgi:hypothetical protein